jgi:predicted small secreted protein
MTTRILTLAVLATSFFLAGCAADFRVGSDRHNVGAGAAIGSPAPSSYPAP